MCIKYFGVISKLIIVTCEYILFLKDNFFVLCVLLIYFRQQVAEIRNEIHFIFEIAILIHAELKPAWNHYIPRINGICCACSKHQNDFISSSSSHSFRFFNIEIRLSYSDDNSACVASSNFFFLFFINEFVHATCFSNKKTIITSYMSFHRVIPNVRTLCCDFMFRIFMLVVCARTLHSRIRWKCKKYH